MAKKAKKNTSKKRKKNKRKKQKQTSLFFAFLKWTITLGLWGLIFLAGVVLWYAKDLPDITQSATFERKSLVVVLAADGSTLTRYGESKGQNIQVDDLPDHLIHAVLATEDRRFYEHPGVDVMGIARAMVVNILKGRFVQGGSTITQQLAKNLFLSHDRKLARKIKEALLALWLEKELTKDEILSAYMNRVYLGSGTYGFDAASRLYFDKPASDVNLREATILAGLLKAPSRYSPHNNIELAKERSKVVINAMIDAGYLTQADLTTDALSLTLPHKKTKSGKSVRYFTDWVIDGMDDLIGSPDMDLTIETTLDAQLQQYAHTQLAGVIDEAEESLAVSQGAILSMRPDGAIITMVGGYDYGESQFNRSTQARRPPGSAFKPIVYLTALENGWDKNDEILDAPIIEGEYRPKNFADVYFGDVTLEHALTKSMNTATVRLTENVGIGNVLSTSSRLGIISNLQRDLSLSLGSSGISMLEMGIAYSVLANGGHRIYPYAITKITNGEGRVLYERIPPKSYQPIVRRKHVKDLTSMLENVIAEGTGRRARLPFSAAGKTGTSQDSRDAWFIGYTNKMVSVVWLGNDDNSPMLNVTGGSLPAQIWRDVMLFGAERHNDLDINSSQSESGISGLLGRILSSGTTSSTADFSNLND